MTYVIDVRGKSSKPERFLERLNGRDA